MGKDQKCPICSTPVVFSERYPQYVCDGCFIRATDADSRSLSFSNASLSGGFAAIYRDTHEESNSHICYIDGIKCWADEASFGGIVIKPYEESSE
jgi:hypothetical protein